MDSGKVDSEGSIRWRKLCAPTRMGVVDCEQGESKVPKCVLGFVLGPRVSEKCPGTCQVR